MTAASQATNEVGDKPAQETILISYVGSDLMWAEWIKEQLERVGSTVEAVEWDGGPDTDPLSTLRRTQEHYSQCVAILSGAYLQAVVPDEGLRTATAAWAAANPRALTPVLVSRSQLPPRFWQLGPVDLHEITDEREARRRLLTRILDRNKAIAGTDNESEPMTRFPGRRPPVWSSRLPARNPYFTGRDGMLRDLRRRLTADVTALLPHSLQGMSGVGKTQLAIEYAHRFAADYDIVLVDPGGRAGASARGSGGSRPAARPGRAGRGNGRTHPRGTGRAADGTALSPVAAYLRQRGKS